MKKRLFSLALALIMLISLVPAVMAADAPMFEFNTDLTGNGMNSKAVGIYDAEYEKYFDDDGIYGIVTDGNFYINDFKVPASAEEFAALGEDGFVVNTGEKLAMTITADGQYKVGKKTTADYAEAIKKLVHDELPGGLHYELYDNNGDAKADVVKLWFTEGVIVNEITKDADGNYILSRGDLTYVPANAGRLYDGNSFAAESIYDQTIKAENFDTTIKEGDCAIFYKTPDGWVVKRAIEANGMFMGGEDHHFYNVDGVEYTDTMKYSRDNLIVAQRNGEYTNAHNYFGFVNNAEGLKTSLWMDTFSKAPIGLSANENAKAFLTSAVAQAKAKLALVALTDAATAQQKFAYAALEDAIKQAEATLADETSYNSEYDFYTYYLYLALAGTGSDIGAAFSGFFSNKEFGWEKMNAYPGFEALFNIDENGALIAGVDTVRTGNMGGLEEGIYDHPEYFDEKGVMGVVEAGGFYVNDFRVPATAEELGADGFVVNSDTASLTVKDGKYAVGKNSFDSYADAVKALVNDDLPGGLHYDLYDTDGDDKAEVVKMWYTEGVIINSITKDANGDYVISRGDLTYVPSNAGRLYDADNFSGKLGETVKPENFDSSIKEGDAAIFYYTPDGWIMERATEANGMFMGGEDHHFYNIDGVEYTDTMKYSRDNLIVAQRNGEYTNAHKYFGFINNAEGLKTSLWMDPKSASPIGLSANENAKAFLTSAVAQAKAKLAAVTLTDAATAEQKFACTSLEEAIELAEKTLADASSLNSEYDFYTYYLYLSLAGTGNDIGAAFSGFYSGKAAGFDWGFKNAYPGFDALFAAAEPEAPAAGQTYTVVSGDCLWNLAAKFLGNGALFGKIAEANGIAAPYTIYAGQTLTIPGK